MKTTTNIEPYAVTVSNSVALWCKYVNPDDMEASRAEFYSMTQTERVAFLEDMFGAEEPVAMEMAA